MHVGEQAVRSQVMMAAARMFAQHGYRAVSVEELLTAANISRRTFYKTFTSKEDVGLALYKFGTDNLLESCRRALGGDGDLESRILQCVDLHLKNAGMMGRLVYVLGGEASHQESPLFAMRMATHDRLVEMLVREDTDVDPLFVRTLILALEAVVRCVLLEGDEGRKVTPASIAHARKVIVRVITGAIAARQ